MTTQTTVADVLESALRPVRAQLDLARPEGRRQVDEPLNHSTGIYFKPDDHGNYIGVIIWRLRARASIRSGEPYRPMPKPIFTRRDILRTQPLPTTVNLGARKRYTLGMMLGVYQFHRAGQTEQQIANDTGIPIMDIRKMLEHKTQTQRRAWLLAHQLPLPAKQEIICRLVKEH
ncbi:hypothetical protein [Yersinia ruckeri]|uniref:hypothetical protein n=1 Tax=Yersinia ruckeri TaxID=29486 RepID=UPI000B11FC63|nr:hypothetical protein [Yersinia ruckeri]MCK8585288.1 hypothetical protein [Yersinia ruckeri]MCW6524255.1 hypothetical protein [Yersinia ruckeri]MCW6528381.1 hypothetical protein [Yersinia ruckeri]MCW6563329.1 hypothetical protein [Yersinia ruckeri]MCW6604748.1 hypothetical protein [Yersinia ruckeri]